MGVIEGDTRSLDYSSCGGIFNVQYVLITIGPCLPEPRHL